MLGRTGTTTLNAMWGHANNHQQPQLMASNTPGALGQILQNEPCRRRQEELCLPANHQHLDSTSGLQQLENETIKLWPKRQGWSPHSLLIAQAHSEPLQPILADKEFLR